MDASGGDFNEQVAVLKTTISYDLSVRLTNLLSETRYNLIQSNGQRIYGPPPNWKGPRPPKGCEIFVGRLPHDAYEDELIPIFSRAGKIYELRLMMEFSGYTRGFCFVVYVNREGANKAVRMLHLLRIRPDVKITVYHSLDNSRLFVGGIPFEKTKGEIWRALGDILDGITNVIMYPNPHERNKNRGYVFVDFISHKHAMEARKMMWPSRLVIWGAQLHAEWAVPLPVESNLRKLFISNLGPSISRESLTQFILDKTKNSSCIVHVYRQRNFAIVQFTSRQNAHVAFEALTGSTIDGNEIAVEWMRNKHGKKSPPSAQQNAGEGPKESAEETETKLEDQKRPKRNTWRPRKHETQRQNFLGLHPPQSHQDGHPSDAPINIYSGDPLYYSPSEPPHHHFYLNPPDGATEPPPNSQLLPPVYLPHGGLLHYNSFAPPDSFQPFVASTPLPMQMMTPRAPSEVRGDRGFEFNGYFPPLPPPPPSPNPNFGGPPAHMFGGTPPVAQAQANPFFVSLSYDGGAAGGGAIFKNRVS